jgi:hypothetical protein
MSTEEPLLDAGTMDRPDPDDDDDVDVPDPEGLDLDPTPDQEGDDAPQVAIVVAPGKVIPHGSNPGPLPLAIDYRPILEVRSYLP